jgi:quercetin dioxygenase-like cupin family protein
VTTVQPVPDVRLVVTSHDGARRGRVVADSLIGPKAGLAADGWQAYVLWATAGRPNLPDDGLGSIDTGASGPGSIRLVECVVYPQGQQAPEGDAQTLTPIERTAGDNSAMHFTRTIDLVAVLDGEVEIVLDEGSTLLRAGDFLVQNGTRHEWRNPGSTPARLAVVVLATHHAGF